MTTSRKSQVNNSYYCDDQRAVISLVHNANNIENPHNAVIVIEYIGEFDSYVIETFEALPQQQIINHEKFTRHDFLDHYKNADCYAKSFYFERTQIPYLISSIHLFDIKVLTQQSLSKFIKFEEIKNPFLWASKKIKEFYREEETCDQLERFKNEAWHVYDFSPSYLSFLANETLNLANASFELASSTTQGIYAGGKYVVSSLLSFSLFRKSSTPQPNQNNYWKLIVVLNEDETQAPATFLLLEKYNQFRNETITTQYHMTKTHTGYTMKFNHFSLSHFKSQNYYTMTYFIDEDSANAFMTLAWDTAEEDFVKHIDNGFAWMKKLIVHFLPEEEDVYATIDIFKSHATHVNNTQASFTT